MTTQKTKALALMALGLTGILFGFAAGLLATTTPEQADIDLLTHYYLISIVFGPCVLLWGGTVWEAAKAKKSRNQN